MWLQAGEGDKIAMTSTSSVVTKILPTLAAIASLTMGSAVEAHHSFAMFDQTRTVVSTAVVKRIEWTNPHAYLFFMVAGKTGAEAKMAIECGSVSLLVRKGWKVNSVRVGDTVTVTYHPFRDGRTGGMLVSVGMANGTVLRG